MDLGEGTPRQAVKVLGFFKNVLFFSLIIKKCAFSIENVST